MRRAPAFGLAVVLVVAAVVLAQALVELAVFLLIRLPVAVGQAWREKQAAAPVPTSAPPGPGEEYLRDPDVASLDREYRARCEAARVWTRNATANARAGA